MKKGISPLIATVLLIGFTIVLAALVMRWGSDLFIKTTESTSEDIESNLNAAMNVDLEITAATYDANNVYVTIDNRGQQDISGFILRISSSTSTITVNLGPLPAFNSQKFTASLAGLTGTPQRVEVIPQIIYNSKTVTLSQLKKTYTLSVGTTSCASTPLTLPSSVSITSTSSGTASLTWTNTGSSDFGSVLVQYGKLEDDPYAGTNGCEGWTTESIVVDGTCASQSSTIITGLESVDYHFCLYSCGSSGCTSTFVSQIVTIT